MPKILVADDNTNIQKMVSLAFEERGIDVVSVGNGEAAVRRIPDMNPDLVLADIFMPVRNGYEVCEFVKKDSRFSHVPVILLVGAFDPLDEKEARRVGADGVLKKPFVPPDPLIAMVISALEKNPKLAAELAKARDVAAAPPPPAEPMPAALEAPVRAEIKPLPEFPEPETPEEAALVYGFGSGKRGKEDPTEADKGPVSLDVVDVEAEEEQHAGASGADWRRSAMDFEIPEETSKSTAFALDEDATVMFPSERDVPPKHVSPKAGPKFGGAAEVPEIPVAAVAPPLPAAPTASIPPPPVSTLSMPVAPPPPPMSEFSSAPPPKIEPKVEAKSEPKDESKIETVPSAASDSSMSATMWGATAVVAAPPVVEAVKAEEAKIIESPVAAAKTEAAVEPAEQVVKESAAKEVAAEAATVIESSFGSRATHWMDAMKAALTNSDAEAAPAKTAPVEKAEVEVAPLAPPPPPVATVEAKVEAAPPPAPVMEAVAAAPPPVAEAVAPPAAASAVPAEELAVMSEPLQPEGEEFFADADEGSVGWIAVESADAKKVQSANDPALETSGPVALGSVATDPELVQEVDTSGPIAKDPALVVPPSVKVVPEPLLVDETVSVGKSGYDEKPEETAAPFEFANEPEIHAAAPEVVAASEPEPVAAKAEPEIDERIPTGPPPNMEALAEIPFLTPPPEFLAANSATGKSDNQDVDELVRKVMEKLEPQLHNLLSQGVLKPLVENIIQGDHAKKER